jgi:hypothetical protein
MKEAYELRDGLSLTRYFGYNEFIIEPDKVQAIETVKDVRGFFIRLKRIYNF